MIEINKQNKEESVGFVITGGTIGSEIADSIVHLSTSQKSYDRELDLIFTVIKEARKDRNITLNCGWPFQPGRPLQKLSENMVPKDWVTIANTIVKLVKDCGVSGVIVLHGTDTASYTAAALSFLTSDLEVPVVLTGSHLPLDEKNSDARTNVYAAAIAAHHLGPGTYLAFRGTLKAANSVHRSTSVLIHRGTNVRKVKDSEEPFESVNSEPVAMVIDGEFRFNQYQSVSLPRTREGEYVRQVDDRVLAIKLYPGINLQLLLGAAAGGGMRGVVVELYPSGTGPVVQGPLSLPNFIEKCKKNDMVVLTTVTAARNDYPRVYETAVDISKAKPVSVDDMIPETAIVKLMWALAQSSSADEVENLILKPIVQETSD